MLKYKYYRPSLTPEPATRNASPAQSFKGSTSSLASSSDGTARRRKKKPAPPPPKLEAPKAEVNKVRFLINFVE
jgi:hypothetical protein